MVRLLHVNADKQSLLDSSNATYIFNRTELHDYISLNTRAVNANHWGPRRDSLYIVVPITIVYATIFLTGVIGNVSTCIVIARNKSMHTATNYYLFSLAVSDLLLLVSGLPPEMYMIWSKYPYIFGEAFCILQGFAAETSANATVLTITAFTIERYVAICHPFLSHTMSKLSRAVRFVIAIWLIAMCLAVPQAMSFGLVYDVSASGEILDNDHTVCTLKRIVIPHTFEISTFVFFVAPMSLITILYVLIGLQLRRTSVVPKRGGKSGASIRLKHRIFRQKRTTTVSSLGQVVIVTPRDDIAVSDDRGIENDEDEDGRKNFPRNAQCNSTRHVVRMLVAVVVAFFVCWAPFHAQRLLAIYGNPERGSGIVVAVFRVMTYVSGVLYYVSTTINPLLYHIMSHKFREAFKDTFTRFLKCNHQPHEHRCYSTLSGRSSQLNSHSGNTDSAFSRQSSLRYLEADMARLQDPRRPLVVSFRRKRPQPPPAIHTGLPFDSGFEEVLLSLSKTKQRRSPSRYMDSRPTTDRLYTPEISSSCFLNSTISDNSDSSFVEMHSLQPTHICPLLTTQKRTYPRIEDIEIFQSQTFKVNRIDSTFKYEEKINEHDKSTQKSIPKSCTMPRINHIFDEKNGNGWDGLKSQGKCSPTMFHNDCLDSSCRDFQHNF